MVNFEISSTVPVCCITVRCDVTLFAVKHKNLKIRQILLYVSIWSYLLFGRFQQFDLTVLESLSDKFKEVLFIQISANIEILER